MPRLPRSRLLPASATTTTGSSVHLSVPCLHTSTPKTYLPPFSHPSLPKAESSSPPSPPPRMSDSHSRHYEIYYDFICSKYRVLHLGIKLVGYFYIIIYHILYVCFIITNIYIFPMNLSIISLLTWPPCIASVLHIRDWSSLPGAEASDALGTIPIGLCDTLSPISHTYVQSSLVLLFISVPSFHTYLP